VALGTNNMTVTTGNVFRPNVWSKEVLMFVQSNLVLVPLVKHYDRDIASFGQTVEIPNVSTITANDKAAGTQVTLNAPTETKTTLNINKHKEASFFVEDILAAQSQYDIRSDYTKAAAYAISEKMDNDIATAMVAGFTTNTAVGTYGSAITDAVVLAAQLALDTAKAPQSERVLVVTPKGKADMLGIDKYVRYDALGVGGDQNSIKTGKIGEIYGAEVFMSQNLVVTAGTPIQNNCLYFHKEAFAIAIQKQPRTQTQYKQEYLAWLVTVDVLYGISVLRNAFGVLVKA
jgi:hypothetical protein